LRAYATSEETCFLKDWMVEYLGRAYYVFKTMGGEVCMVFDERERVEETSPTLSESRAGGTNRVLNT